MFFNKQQALYNAQFICIFLITACLYVPVVASAQDNQYPSVYLKSGLVSPVANAGRWLDSVHHLPVHTEPLEVLIHFSTLPTAAQKASLKQQGITLMDYVPDNTYVALVKPLAAKEAVMAAPVYSIIDIKPDWKADPYVWDNVASQKGTVQALISFYPGIDAAEIRQFIARTGGSVVSSPFEQYGSYKVSISGAKLHSVAQWYGVRYMSQVTDIVPLDLQSRPAVKGNVAVASPLMGGYGLTGAGVTVGVGDNSSGIYHADINDRIVNFNPGPLSNHGEHVNGIVGGAANIDPLAAGMASHVQLIDHLYDLILPATGALYHDYNMTITNNSYEIVEGNCGYAGTYDVYSQFLDTLSVQYPFVQHVFASGNDGSHNCMPYPPGFATVGGGYQPAKDIIVVGSITDFLYQASDESRGPVKDGRIKPDIVAIGLGAYSTVGIDNYEWAAGTSMASPQVAGGLALLTQHYKELSFGVQPRADVLKTLLLNGAMDLGNPGPDFTYGFGVMDLNRSLQMMDNLHYTSNTIANGDSQTINITVPANTGQLKVMLCWNDVPASPVATKALVNDLDLSVSDPASSIYLPLVPDHTPGNVNNVATQQADHLNNVEQVTINSPAAGTYAVKVKGYSIPSGPQQYVVAYDFVPKAMQLTFPLGGEQLNNVNNPGDSLRVFWDATTDGNTFKVEFSATGGVLWATLSDTIAAAERHFDFPPPAVNSGNCLIRLSRNNTGEVATSGKFAINTQPVVVADTAQCPGYINIHWSAIPNATKYYLLKKVGFYMQVVDSVADTAYSFTGIPLNTTSYVAVQPVINSMPAYRSVALSMTPNAGNCTLPVSAGDIMIDKIVAPQNGRMYTSSQFVATTFTKVQLRNLYRAPCSNYSISYQVNSGAWTSLTGSGPIPGNGTIVVSIPGLPFEFPGTYHVLMAVHNLDLTDPQPHNDTLAFTVLNILNDSLDLTTPFSDDFETMPVVSVNHDTVGMSPNGHWDYFNANDSGRVRSFVSDDITISGSRSMSLDDNQCAHAGSLNTFVGTFNLARYDTSSAEVRLDFDYLLHGTPKAAAGNIVTARGTDTAGWQPLYAYNLNAYPGFITHVQSLSLTDALRASGKDFSSSTQVSFGQSDTSLISAVSYGNGITLDNFKMYTVVNDAAMMSVVSPLPSNCGLPSPQPLVVQLHNGVNHTLYNVQVSYTLDGGTVYTDNIDSIAAKATIDHTFAQELAVPPGSTHTVNTWLNAAGDSYAANDSILSYHFRNSFIINVFPYLENFEQGDGGYFSDGFKDSWQYGTPATGKVYKAASGTKAWKTNLTGNYNNLELSYLYSPCFDISSLANPMLSFSAAMAIENCGPATLCDAGWVEYSYDGELWTKLGITGQGTNWYDSSVDVWNNEGFTRWHVASIPLPVSAPGQVVHFRFVMSADPGVTFDGMSIDDIHVYDRKYAIYPVAGVTVLSQNLSGNSWIDYTTGNQLLASVQPNGQDIANAEATLYRQDAIINPGATQYVMPRSYTVKAGEQPAGNTGMRLYLLDSEVVHELNDTGCASCTRAPDAYSLGITQYDHPGNANLENGTLTDDTGGVFTYYPYKDVKWVPYDQGYYAEIQAKPFSEFWFNDGGPTASFPAGVDYLYFTAYRSGRNVQAAWYSLIDTAVHLYTVERSLDKVVFDTVANVTPKILRAAQYVITDTAAIANTDTLYYRLQWTMPDKATVYSSPIRELRIADSAVGQITFNAYMIDNQSVYTTWSSAIDGLTDHYILERGIASYPYDTIATVASLHGYGLNYNYTDKPGRQLPEGMPVHYRLTAVLHDTSLVQPPLQTVAWVDGSAVVNIYPDPTHDGRFAIQWEADAGTVMNISITDAVGKRIYQSTAKATQWNNTTSIQTLSYPRGIYFVKMEIGGKTFVKKLVYE